ncbi:MAG: glycosyltransferase [Lentisphaeria bacterium]|nr:glycosyltransferase [Lentisphaeria bacterium]
MVKALIIIPCYNEAERLNIPEFTGFLAGHPEISLLFVDDGSTDGTAGVLKSLAAEFANADCLILSCNSGKAEAVRQGMLFAAGKDVPFAGFLDADLATPLPEIIPMLAEAEKGKFYVSGCRLARLGSNIRRHLHRHLMGRIFATVVSMHLDLVVYDTQCGAKIFASEMIPFLFDRPFVTKWFFDVEILRRMISRYGKEQLLAKSLEYPLSGWIDQKGSKINYFSALKDFIRLLLSKN